MGKRWWLLLSALLLAAILGTASAPATPSGRQAALSPGSSGQLGDLEMSCSRFHPDGDGWAAVLTVRNTGQEAQDLRALCIRWTCGRESGLAEFRLSAGPVVRPGRQLTGWIHIASKVPLRTGAVRLFLSDS